jgi:glucosamine--fructose-6-phosphate aminotransferase (isomerizing)
MCGIFGLVIARHHVMNYDQWKVGLTSLFKLSETRGKEAAGIAIAMQRKILVHKDAVSASEMVSTADYARILERAQPWFFDDTLGESALATIGHSRLVTNGMQGIAANNQPVWRDDVVIVHNGIVVNVDALWEREKANGLAPRADVDTEVIAALLNRYRENGASVQEAVSNVYDNIYGETSIAVFLRDLDALVLATNTGSLYLGHLADGSGVFFASERAIVEQLISGSNKLLGFEAAEIHHLRPGQGMMIPLTTCELQRFVVEPRGNDGHPTLARPAVEPMLSVQRDVEEKSTRQREAMRSLRRCSRCLLPETMPFICYDSEGVCNYCHNYTPWVRRPEDELEHELSRYRSKDSSPDCVVAFSGGRDSSYGLHLLKTRYGMTPLCFSYDWGMVTDLARRNQARMCGKLGVEHIWISADIKQKRANIRANVLAWLKKPDLGLIPLFMAGDKQFFWHASKTIKSTGLKLSVFCTNRLEKTDFKTGFLGIPPVDTEMRNKPSSLRLKSKVDLAWGYGSRFLSNPRYLNRSIPDTLFAAFSYYGIEQDHLFMFDHLLWDENTINDTLISEYQWETAPDTPSTWRIGDGTQPWYNYIYFTVAGFTEFDTFRSNQIREGMINRSAALESLEQVNEPRWGAIRDYMHLINVDFDEAIRVVDRIPKLYIS